jgi:hypothetical protein
LASLDYPHVNRPSTTGSQLQDGKLHAITLSNNSAVDDIPGFEKHIAIVVDSDETMTPAGEKPANSAELAHHAQTGALSPVPLRIALAKLACACSHAASATFAWTYALCEIAPEARAVSANAWLHTVALPGGVGAPGRPEMPPNCAVAWLVIIEVT